LTGEEGFLFICDLELYIKDRREITERSFDIRRNRKLAVDIVLFLSSFMCMFFIISSKKKVLFLDGSLLGGIQIKIKEKKLLTKEFFCFFL